MTSTTSSVYVASPIRRQRRTKTEVEHIKAALAETIEKYKPMTVRQVFYQMVTQGVIDKSENEYNCTVVRLLGEMRWAGEIPFNSISDNTRWMRKPDTHCSIQAMLRETAKFYRRDLWHRQPAYVEIWLEKEALAGVLYDVTQEWDVPLMVCRGYASLSFLHSAAGTISSLDKPAYLYYFGDHDPSGLNIPVKVEETLRKLAPQAEIHFQRVAVNETQIAKWNLPTRPTKKTDSRAKGFTGESIEVDAIPPNELRRLARKCIEQHVDDEVLEATRRVEQAELHTLKLISDNYADVADFAGGLSQ